MLWDVRFLDSDRSYTEKDKKIESTKYHVLGSYPA